jgi:hypothetical protein
LAADTRHNDLENTEAVVSAAIVVLQPRLFRLNMAMV